MELTSDGSGKLTLKAGLLHAAASLDGLYLSVPGMQLCREGHIARPCPINCSKVNFDGQAEASELSFQATLPGCTDPCLEPVLPFNVRQQIEGRALARFGPGLGC